MAPTTPSIDFIEGRSRVFSSAMLAIDKRLQSRTSHHTQMTIRILAFGGLSELPDYDDDLIEQDPKVRWLRKLQHLTREPEPGVQPPLQVMAIYDLPLTKSKWDAAKFILSGFQTSTSARIKILPSFKLDPLPMDQPPASESFSRTPALSCCILDNDAALVGIGFGEWVVRTEATLAVYDTKFSFRLKSWFDEFPWSVAKTIYDPADKSDIHHSLRQIENEYRHLFQK